MGKIAELRNEVESALNEAKSAVENINFNINVSGFSGSMDDWASIIEDNAQNNSGIEEWKRINGKKKEIDDALNSIKKGVGNISAPTGEVTTS